MPASGKTFLQIINAVLPRLRESTVAANNSTTYSTMVGGIVNQVKAEIEAAYPWRSLRSTITVNTATTDALGKNYTLTGAGPDGFVVDAWNTTQFQRLRKITTPKANNYLYGSSTASTGPAAEYIPTGLDATSSYDRQVNVFPAPAAAEVLKFEVYIPQADLAADATVPLVPQSLLIEETIARCMVERGDDSAPKPQPGETFILSELLAAYVSEESALDDKEMDWDTD